MADSPQTTPDRNSLLSDSLLKKIDELREKNIGKHVPLPQLVVVGDQSSGKSSLLESLTGIRFPSDIGLCTRYATQFTQRRDDVPRVEVTIIPGPRASKHQKKRLRNFRSKPIRPENFRAEFPAILREVNAAMGIRANLSSKDGIDSGYSSDKPSDSQEGTVFSEDVLKIEICGPTEDYLTVIDVPGIFRTPEEGCTTKEDIALVRNMVEGYIKDSRTVILAVLDSNIDISNQEILTLAKEYDEKGERTLGILTKPDRVKEAKLQTEVCNIVLGKKKPLTLGYYVVRNRGPDQDDAHFNRREKLFEKEPWNTLPKERVGVSALKKRLAELLGHIARREFPRMRKDIDRLLDDAKLELNRLGAARENEHQQRMFLSDMARKFQNLVRAGLEAEYASHAAFDKSTDLCLITHVVNLAEAFSLEFMNKGHLRRFDDEDEDEDENVDERDSEASDISKVMERVPRLDSEAFPELENIVLPQDDVEDPEDGIMDWIRDLHLRSRGMNLATFSNGEWASAFKEQSNKWPSMSKSFVSRVIVAIHRFLDCALRHVCSDESVRDTLWSALLKQVLQRYKMGMDAAEFLVSVEREGKPYTLDNCFNQNRQEAQAEKIAELLRRKYAGRLGTHPTISIRQVRDAVENKSNLDDTVEKLHDNLEAYYTLAQKRFVDNILNQAVNYHLLFGPSTPLGVFSQEWVLRLGAEQLGAIAGESPSVSERRASLTRKIQDLNDAKRILCF
ncbi:hypothetical protein N656DRAFT_765234 [Canariomyces notabilis]|uniref:Uncharacterized protein n=1 Tax=Canariomyces notabilis TaxID=2074819 RepID=A0AAN6TKL2_9PEZI|nr:hypothetical protein N656DRAFT_765234 [Canariomyces arenarius]